MSELKSWRKTAYEIIYESNTTAGKAFDIALLVMIILSVLVVSAESVEDLSRDFGAFFKSFEWFITAVFTVEYVLRVAVVKHPNRYILSPLGIIDLLAVLPVYIGLMMSGAYQYALILRILRLIRIFRILKLVKHIREIQVLALAIKSSIAKITVFLEIVLALVILMGTVMYLIEGPDNGFTSIPKSIYWAIVTLTTVGFGDLVPKTALGQFVASGVMIIGYAVLAVPTGIVSVEMMKASQKRKITTQVCEGCNREGHDVDAKYCKFCGSKL